MEYNETKELPYPYDKHESFRKELIRKIVEEDEVLADIPETYSIFELLNPNMLASLLFYKGVLTIKGTFGDLAVLGFPNRCVRQLYEKELSEFIA